MIFYISLSHPINFQSHQIFVAGTLYLVLGKPKFVTLAGALCSLTPRALRSHHLSLLSAQFEFFVDC